MYLSAPTNRYYRPRIRIDEARAEIRIPVREEFFHVAGAVHGSVYFKALDDAAFFAASSLVDDVFLLTASFHIHLTRPVSEGEMVATGRVIHRARRVFVADSELLDSEGRHLGRGSGTFMRSRIELAEELGYA